MPQSTRVRLVAALLYGASAVAHGGGISPVFPDTIGTGIDCEFPSIAVALATAAAQPGAQTYKVTRSAAHVNLALHTADAEGVTLEGGYATCSSGRDAVKTELVGDGTQPVIRTAGAGDLVLRNLVIRGGRGVANGGAYRNGGGVWHGGSGELRIEDSSVQGNVGGIHVEGDGSAVVRASAVASPDAPALSADTGGSLRVEDSDIADAPVGISVVRGRLDVVGGRITGNGTGVGVSGPDAALLVDVEISGNAGIGVGTGGSGTLELDGVQLLDNGTHGACGNVGQGALAVLFATGAVTVRDSTIAGNCRGVNLLQSRSLFIERSTIADNIATAQDGGGLRIQGDRDAPPAVVTFGEDVIVERNDPVGLSAEHAILDLSDAPRFAIRDNARGGITLFDSSARIGSGGAGGGIRGNTGPGVGMGGASALLLYTTDPAHPAGLWDNGHDGDGGGLYVAASDAGQTVRMYDVQIEGNSASSGAAIAMLGGLGGETRFCMGRAIEPDSCSDLGGALPANARSCADPAACNVIRDNVMREGDIPFAVPGGVVLRGTNGIAAMPMRFVGARFTGNEGLALFTSRPMQPATPAPVGALELRDSVVAANTVTGALFDSATGLAGYPPNAAFAFGALTLDRSTVAGNGIGANLVASTRQELIAYESIVHQPGKRIHAGLPAGIDARAVIVSDATDLPARADVVVADPLLVDAANGNVRLQPGSPALDFSNVGSGGLDIDGVPRGQDAPGAPTRFGLRDLGAHERGVSILFRDGFE